jgi:hypothetical protein
VMVTVTGLVPAARTVDGPHEPPASRSAMRKGRTAADRERRDARQGCMLRDSRAGEPGRRLPGPSSRKEAAFGCPGTADAVLTSTS